MIFVDISRLCLAVCQANWRRGIRLGLHIITLAATMTLEKNYHSHRIPSVENQFMNHDLMILIILVCYVVLLLWIQKWILNSIEKDMTIDKNKNFDKAIFGIPCYSFKKYRDLIKIESIDFHYQGFNEERPHSVTTVVGYLRYGLVKFEMEKYSTVIVTEQMMNSFAKIQPRVKDVENDS